MNRRADITALFGIRYPIVQAGMVWTSGWRLASAVSNAGGLGLIGAGSMHPDTFLTHIRKCKAATNKPFGVNVPLLYPQMDDIMAMILKEKVPIVFTSAGNPASWTPTLKAAGITVVHVVSSVKFALKAQAAGVDAVVAEGFEAGGHNGREETTTFALIPMVRKATALPLIAAGGSPRVQECWLRWPWGPMGYRWVPALSLPKKLHAIPGLNKPCLTPKRAVPF